MTSLSIWLFILFLGCALATPFYPNPVTFFGSLGLGIACAASVGMDRIMRKTGLTRRQLYMQSFRSFELTGMLMVVSSAVGSLGRAEIGGGRRSAQVILGIIGLAFIGVGWSRRRRVEATAPVPLPSRLGSSMRDVICPSCNAKYRTNADRRSCIHCDSDLPD